MEGMQVDGMVKRYSHIQLEVKRAAIQADSGSVELPENHHFRGGQCHKTRHKAG